MTNKIGFNGLLSMGAALALIWGGLGLTEAAAQIVHSQGDVRPSVVAGRLRRSVSFEQPDYNLKFRAITFNVTAALRAEYDDNINLSETDPVGDVIITPIVGLSMYWPITPFNALRLNTSIGYQMYMDHDELSHATTAFTVTPDSELNFDIYTGNFIINIHDRFSLLQDPVGEPTLSNVADFGRFQNTAGISVLWMVNSKVSATVGYDHTDSIATNSRFDFTDYSQDLFTGSARFEAAKGFFVGPEAGISNTRYRRGEKADATVSHAGAFAEAVITPYTRLRGAVGIQTHDFDDDSSVVIEFRPERGRSFFEDDRRGGGDQTTLYWNAQLYNRMSRHFTQTVTAGKESQLGLTSQRVDLIYARYSGTWQINSQFALHGDVFFEDGEEHGARDPESFQRWGAGIATSYRLSRKLNLTVGYTFVHKDSSLEFQSYRNNRVYGQLTYDF